MIPLTIGVEITKGPYCGRCGEDFQIKRVPCDHAPPCLIGFDLEQVSPHVCAAPADAATQPTSEIVWQPVTEGSGLEDLIDAGEEGE